MAGFLVEIRLHGYAKEYAKETIYSVAKKYRVRGATRKKVVPHISLYGPGEAINLRKVISTIEKVGKKYTLVPFEIKGFGSFETKPKVIYFDIESSQELETLRWELSQELRKISSCQPWDSQKKHHFHATIAFKDIDYKFNKIWPYLKNKEEPHIKQYLTRITVLGHGRRIVCEYDLILKRLLNRNESLNRVLRRKTMVKLREIQGLPPEQPPSTKNWLQKLLDLLNQ